MIEISRIVKSDTGTIQGVINLNAEDLREPYINTNNLNDIFADLSQIFLIAKCEKKLVGFLHCNFKVSDNTELLSIAVARDFREQGIATQLFEYLLNELKGRGIEKIFLEVSEKNVGARALYTQLGFKEYTVRRKYYPNGEDAICMFLSIN